MVLDVFSSRIHLHFRGLSINLKKKKNVLSFEELFHLVQTSVYWKWRNEITVHSWIECTIELIQIDSRSHHFTISPFLTYSRSVVRVSLLFTFALSFPCPCTLSVYQKLTMKFNRISAHTYQEENSFYGSNEIVNGLFLMTLI